MALTQPCPRCKTGRCLTKQDQCWECLEARMAEIDYTDRDLTWKQGRWAIRDHRNRVLYGDAH